MKQTSPIFVLDGDYNDTKWVVKIYTSTDNSITIGMFWGDKDTPTHTFSSSKRAFRKMIDTLAPRKEKKLIPCGICHELKESKE